MPRFPSAQFAYCWAFEILDVWRAGKGPKYERGLDEELQLSFGKKVGKSSGGSVPTSVHIAMDIESLAGKACKHNRIKCRSISNSCFVDWYIPAQRIERTQQQEDQVRECIGRFRELLKGIGWVE